MAHEAEFRRKLAQGVVASTAPVVDLKSLLSKDSYNDLKDYAIPAMNRLLNELLRVMETPKVGALGFKKTKAEHLKGEEKDDYEACFKGVRKEDIDALKGVLRGDVSLHGVSIAHSFLETILAMEDRTSSCAPFKSSIAPILKEAKRLHGKTDSAGKPDSKTLGFTMHFIQKNEAVSAYIKRLPTSAAAAAALSAAKGKNEVAALQARLNALRDGRSAISVPKRGGRRVTRRRSSSSSRGRRATRYKRR